MKNIVITLLTALIPVLVSAQEWIEISKQETETLYIYDNIIDEYGDHLVWTKTTYNTPEARKNAMKEWGTKNYIFELKVLYSLNSEWSKICTKSSSFYSESGKVLDSYTAPYDDWQYIAPETMGELIRDAAKYIYEKSRKLAD